MAQEESPSSGLAPELSLPLTPRTRHWERPQKSPGTASPPFPHLSVLSPRSELAFSQVTEPLIRCEKAIQTEADIQWSLCRWLIQVRRQEEKERALQPGPSRPEQSPPPRPPAPTGQARAENIPGSLLPLSFLQIASLRAPLECGGLRCWLPVFKQRPHLWRLPGWA